MITVFISFPTITETGDEKMMTVAEYFEQKYTVDEPSLIGSNSRLTFVEAALPEAAVRARRPAEQEHLLPHRCKVG